MAEFRYKAFVSYSWSDAEWGKWLLHEIETYRTPKAMIGKHGAHGPVPERLHPLFKDREEEAAGASIGSAVEAALATSEFLIVICSPRSAQSQWVNHEVAWFKTHRDPGKILALIVDGEPGGGELECFPNALTHHVLPDLTVSETQVDSPLAADARISGDGKRKAKLKLAAAMLGIGLGELVNRDEARRTLRTRIVVGASLALAAVMSGMAWYAIYQRNEAEHQRAESDGLVEFMLTDLRERLEPVGRLDALDVVGQRALKYYAGQKASRLDADALGRRARALHLVGEVSNIRGDSVSGLTAFRQAAATTAEQLARDPDNPQRIFDHAQSVFWVGYVAYERGDLKGAETQWTDYERLAGQLVAMNPNKPEWQLEMSYAKTNLGVLFFEQGRLAEAEPKFALAMKFKETVAAANPDNASRQLELGSAINWLGKVQEELHRIPQAMQLHIREIALYQKVLKSDPSNAEAKRSLAVAWQHLGQLELISGKINAAIAATGNSLVLIRQLRTIEPGNTEWQEIEVRALLGQAGNLSFTALIAERDSLHAAASSLLNRMIATDPKNAAWTIALRSTIVVQSAMFKLQDGKPREALALARSAIASLANAIKMDPAESAKLTGLARLTEGDAMVLLGQAGEAKAAWQSGLQALSGIPENHSSLVLRTKFALQRRLGGSTYAQALAVELTRQGDLHPAWLREQSRSVR